MLMPCEVAVKSLVPAIRAFMARELTHSCKLKQNDVASLLGITQTAVSKYARQVRGIALNVEEVEEARNMMMETVEMLANGRLSRLELVERFCIVCRVVRREGLMCQLCKRTDPLLDVQKCGICMLENSACIPNTK